MIYTRFNYIASLSCFIFSAAFSQSVFNSSIISAFPNKLIQIEFQSLKNNNINKYNGLRPYLTKNNSIFNISFNSAIANNIGHSNIDNYAEFYAYNGLTKFKSFRMTYNNKWLFLSLEPYEIKRDNTFIPSKESLGSYQYLNNHSIPFRNKNHHIGLRQSSIIIHYNRVGISYSNASQWWGPGMHSSIALSSNAPGMGTYSLGTFPDIKINKYSFGFRTIVSQYQNLMGEPIYFSGLATHITYESNPTITFGFFRTYLSGNFSNLIDDTSLKRDWTIIDAAKLVFEPLFGQNKSGLIYTTPGTPGFDKWDEVLSGFINITFPKELLKIYFEIASDDNRGNITDLRAHWDHTLGYLVGFRKYFNYGKNKLLLGAEFLSTKISNTYKKEFWRADSNQDNYYKREYYNYFSYNGRRLGGHSGPSSDDFIIMTGFSNQKNMLLFHLNYERHGIKSMVNPELKKEINMTYNYKFNQHHSLFISMEYEHIQNFGFISEQLSESKFFWIGYTFSLR